jgi:hypothetical protein
VSNVALNEFTFHQMLRLSDFDLGWCCGPLTAQEPRDFVSSSPKSEIQEIPKNNLQPNGSSPSARGPATGLHHEPDKFSPHVPTHIFKIHFTTILASTPTFSL